MERLRNKKDCPHKIYVLNGDPVPLARGRFSDKTKRIYDSQKTLKLLNGIALRSQHDDQPMYTGPLHLIVTFFIGIPKNSKRLYYHHTFKPDLDNLIKWICDISNSVLYHDDCTIAKITATKLYDTNARTEFYFEVLD